MKHCLILFALLPVIFSSSCKQEKKASGDDVTVMWTSFLSDLKAEDKEAFKNSSAETVRCYDCLENTPSEAHQISILRELDSLWYVKIYEDLIYIPIDSFIANDYDILFNPQFISILQQNETIYLSEQKEGVTYAHILVTTRPPTAFFEGGQHSFFICKRA